MLNDLERRGLKSVVRVAVKEAGGQENCAAVSSRIKRAAAFSDYGNDEVADRHIPLDVAVEIDRFNKNGRIVRAAARTLGFLLVAMPSRRVAGSTFDVLTTAIKEGSEGVAAVTPLLAAGHDATLSPARREHTITQIDEAIEAFLELRARLQPPADEGDE